MEHKAWIDDLIGPSSYRAAAKAIGTAGPTLTRQLAKGKLSPEMVIALCRAFDRSPVQGLVETGYLHEYELESPDVQLALRQAKNHQVLTEIMRRSDPEALTLFRDPLGEAIDYYPPETDHDHTVGEFAFSPEQYAADSTDDVTEMRLERGEDPID